MGHGGEPGLGLVHRGQRLRHGDVRPQRRCGLRRPRTRRPQRELRCGVHPRGPEHPPGHPSPQRDGDMTSLAKDAGVELPAAHERVVARLFPPGDAWPGGPSRTESLMNRVLSMPPETIPALAQGIVEDFGDRHTRLVELLMDNAAMVRGADAPPISEDLSIVLGAVFTAEFAVEGAALCNPSAVRHPDQEGLKVGELRVLLSMRSIGESHLSSIQFSEAIIGPCLLYT